uniref:Uncharacterized protein n=1 Tax=Arcella intermedia TaxID=1963864 RepID=A0A6B2L7A8_9EUKA
MFNIKLWEIEPELLLRELKGHDGIIKSLSFHPDSKLLASSSYRSIKFWDMETFALHKELEVHENSVSSTTFSPSGDLLISGGFDCQVRATDVERLSFVYCSRCHSHFVLTVAFSPDGKIFASGGKDKKIGLWNINSAEICGEYQPYASLKHNAQITCLTFSPDGKVLASGDSESGIQLWDVDKKSIMKVLKCDEGGIMSIIFTSDGKTLISSGDQRYIAFWDMERMQCVQKIVVKYATPAMAVSPGGDILASASSSNIQLWDLKTKELKGEIMVHSDNVKAIVFSPDGRWLATGGDDKAIHLYEIQKKDNSTLYSLQAVFSKQRLIPSKNINLSGTLIEEDLRSFLTVNNQSSPQ